MTAAERTASARKAAAARWKDSTPEERAAQGRIAGEASAKVRISARKTEPKKEM